MPVPYDGVRIFYITGPDTISAEDFNMYLSRQIKKSNTDFPNCKYIVVENETTSYALNLLRNMGVSPGRITIYHGESIPLNPTHCRTKQFSTIAEAREQATNESSHDITWYIPGSGDTEPELNAARRRAKLQREKSKPGFKNSALYKLNNPL